MKSYLFLAGIALAYVAFSFGCSSTSSTTTGARKITLGKPANQTMKRGDTNAVEIKVWKENIGSDVAVRFDNLPEGVEIVENHMDSKDNHCVAIYSLVAAKNASLVSEQVVRVTAEGPDGLTVTESFEMTVKQ